jgi:gliding motility-associated-like protein
MKKILFLYLAFLLSFTFGSTQILCIYCFDTNDSISNNVTNLVQNGSFENHNCTPNNNGSSFCPISMNYACNLANWTCTGGGAFTYCQIFSNAISAVPDGAGVAYFGNSFCDACNTGIPADTSCLTRTGCEVTGVPPGYPINGPDYGGAAGLSLSQTVTGLTVGATYVLEFWTGGEDFTVFVDPGMFGVDIGFGYNFLTAVPTDFGDIGRTYMIIFNATSTSHTLKWTNWGHICNSCTELALDLVRLYPVSQLDPSVSPCGPPVLSASVTQTPPTCNGLCNGTATATANNGTSPFNYSWSNGQAGQSITGLCAGSYTVTVTDGAGATASASVTIANPAAITVTTTAVPTFCGGANGSATATTGGGAAPLSYSWSPSGQVTQTAIGLNPGTHTVVVTDANGCTATSTTTVGAGLIPDPTWAFVSGGPCLNGPAYHFGPTHGHPLGTTFNWTMQNGNPATSTAQDPFVTFTQAGTHQVTLIVTLAGCSDTLTQSVTVLPVPTVNAGPDVDFCLGGSGQTLVSTTSGGTAPYNFAWYCNTINSPCFIDSLNDDDPLVVPIGTTSYAVQVSDANGCFSNFDTVTVVVNPLPAVALTADTTLCDGDTLVLDAGFGGSTYTWTGGATTQTLAVSAIGTYAVTVTDVHGCIGSDDITITQAARYAFSLGPDSVFCGREPFRLHVGIPNLGIVWSDASTDTSLTTSRDGLYWAQVATECDLLRDSVRLAFLDGNFGPYLPTSFTPNGDGLNDTYQVGGELQGEFHMLIFDRWGKLIFASDDITVSWDGKLNSLPASEGVYAVRVRSTDCHGDTFDVSASVTLIR